MNVPFSNRMKKSVWTVKKIKRNILTLVWDLFNLNRIYTHRSLLQCLYNTAHVCVDNICNSLSLSAFFCFSGEQKNEGKNIKKDEEDAANILNSTSPKPYSKLKDLHESIGRRETQLNRPLQTEFKRSRSGKKNIIQEHKEYKSGQILTYINWHFQWRGVKVKLCFAYTK